MYCGDCVKPYILPTPFRLSDNIEVVSDTGNWVKLRYTGGYYDEIVVEKICYFNRKGRCVKVKGKTYYLKEESEK